MTRRLSTTALIGLGLGALLVLAGAGCLDYEAGSGDAAAFGPVQLVPARVLPDQPVEVHFSAPLADAELDLVVQLDGAEVECDAELRGAQVTLRPRSTWPAPARLEVTARSPIYSAAGEVWAPGALGAFATEDDTRPPTPIAVHGPIVAPANLRFLLLSGEEARVAEVTTVALTGHGPPETGRVVLRAPGRAVVEFAPTAPRCSGACAGRRYAVLAMPMGRAIGSVETSSSADLSPPLVRWVQAMPRGDGVQVRVYANEPVLVRGVLRAPDGSTVLLGVPGRLGDDVSLRAVVPLAPSTRYGIELEVMDVAGHRALVPPTSVQTADVPQVRLTEVVSAPLRDWSNSDGEGVPFDPWPGRGAVTDNDEWIELVNLSDRPVDLAHAGLEIRALDTSPSVTQVDAAPALYFGAGGHGRAWRPGEALVVRPRGSLSQRDLRIEVWGTGVLLDALQLGARADADHPGGRPPDTVHEAIARDGRGAWRWCAPSPGSPAASPACR